MCEQTLSSPIAVAAPHGSVFLSDSIILTSPRVSEMDEGMAGETYEGMEGDSVFVSVNV